MIPVEVFAAERGKTPICGKGRSILVYDAFWSRDPEPQYFLWGCPTCGKVWSGWFAGPKPKPASHTSEWTLTGTREKPTLSPSLVCAGALLGARFPELACSGHFFIRDGMLV